MGNPITDIHCPQCGAPADFDIVRQLYVCGHCGGSVGVSEAQKEKQSYRDRQRGMLRKEIRKYKLFHTACTGCRKAVRRSADHDRHRTSGALR